MDSDEDRPLAGCRQKTRQHVEIFHVIPDEQPLLDRRDHTLLILVVSFRYLEHFNDVQKTGDDVLSGFCPNPEDGTIVQGMLVGIFEGNLCFAYAAQPSGLGSPLFSS